MERNPSPKGGFWMMVEDLTEALLNESNTTENPEEKESPDDEFFPDTSF